jgi:hypothetical protein
MDPENLFNPNGNADFHIPFNIDGIRIWLQSNHPDSYFMRGQGETPLMIVTGSNRHTKSNAYEVAELLIAHGANVNHNGKYGHYDVLGRATSANVNGEMKSKMLELLLKNGANPNFGIAPKRNYLGNLTFNDEHLPILTMLKYGADPNRLYHCSNPMPLLRSLESDKLRENHNFMDISAPHIPGVRNARRQKTINIIKWGYAKFTNYETQYAENKRIEEQQKVNAQKLIEEQKLEMQRLADQRRIQAQKIAEEKRIMEQKAAEEKRIQEQKAAEERRLLEQKVAEERRLLEQKVAEERKLMEQKLAEERRLLEQKAVEERKLAEQKAAEEKRRQEQLAEEIRLEEQRLANKKLEEAENLREANRQLCMMLNGMVNKIDQLETIIAYMTEKGKID